VSRPPPSLLCHRAAPALVCLSVCLCLSASVCLCLPLSAAVSVCLSLSLSHARDRCRSRLVLAVLVHEWTDCCFRSLFLFVRLFMSLSVSLSVSLSLLLSLPLSLCLSVSVFACLFLVSRLFLSFSHCAWAVRSLCCWLVLSHSRMWLGCALTVVECSSTTIPWTTSARERTGAASLPPSQSLSGLVLLSLCFWLYSRLCFGCVLAVLSLCFWLCSRFWFGSALTVIRLCSHCAFVCALACGLVVRSLCLGCALTVLLAVLSPVIWLCAHIAWALTVILAYSHWAVLPPHPGRRPWWGWFVGGGR
jgi:hypothetical protein